MAYPNWMIHFDIFDEPFAWHQSKSKVKFLPPLISVPRSMTSLMVPIPVMLLMVPVPVPVPDLHMMS